MKFKCDDVTAVFDPMHLAPALTKEEEEYQWMLCNCNDPNCEDRHRIACMQCDGYDLNNIPEWLPRLQFCSFRCRQAWESTQPLGNLLYKRAFKRENT